MEDGSETREGPGGDKAGRCFKKLRKTECAYHACLLLASTWEGGREGRPPSFSDSETESFIISAYFAVSAYRRACSRNYMHSDKALFFFAVSAYRRACSRNYMHFDKALLSISQSACRDGCRHGDWSMILKKVLPMCGFPSVHGIVPAPLATHAGKSRPMQFAVVDENSESTSLLYLARDLRKDLAAQFIFRRVSYLAEWQKFALRVVTYDVLPLSTSSGLVEYVPSQTLHEAVRRGRLKPGKSEAERRNYVETCASYTVLGYLLGIGDRHLENILLTEDMCFFYVDFESLFWGSFLTFRACGKIVGGMGGARSLDYRSFLRRCREIFLFLRDNHNEFLSIVESSFVFLDGVSFPLAREKIEKLLRLEWTETDAADAMLREIRRGHGSITTAVRDIVHDIFRKE
ncbi:MAG: Phosphatidylinositol 3-kinase [Amphiamblys sp. WSBS2006]|nr:MAG: Phosphatidylinositol 3-kinase [Amphiamblys sp. WSBS2006]